MRMVFGLAVLAIVWPRVAEAQGFEASCRDITIDGAKLAAECRSRDGTWHHSTVALRSIHNVKGLLVDLDSDQPSEFQNSCLGIAVRGNVLFASCSLGNGEYNRSTLLIRRVKNNDGVLGY